MPDSATAALLGHHAMAAQDVAHRRSVRQVPPGLALVDQGQELLAAPARVTAPRFEDRRHNLLIGAVRRFVRPSRTLLQPGGSLSQVPVDQLVTRLARHPVQLAQLGDAQRLPQVICYELRSLVHRRGLTPRHGHPLLLGARSVVQPVTYVPRLNCYLCIQTVPQCRLTARC
jgi:hypothetical protein